MTIADAIREAVMQLPVARQQQALNYVKSLAPSPNTPSPRRDLKGIFAGQIPDLSFEDFQAVRRGMSTGFPRDAE